MNDPKSVYQYPRYYAIGYQWNTEAECNFLEACLTKYGGLKSAAVLDIGCGAGRHLLELAKRSHPATGFDLRPEMVAFVKNEAKRAKLPVTVSVGDLRQMALQGSYGLAYCLMDTFRYLLTNEEIIEHLTTVAAHLSPGGLYVTDFWIPRQWDQIGNEVYQWEQTKDDTKVRVFYLQHPESIDPISQTFEDELVFAVEEDGQSREIYGERTRTRLLMPQEFFALVAASGAFDVVGACSEFDLDKPLEASSMSWRMVSVLKQRP